MEPDISNMTLNEYLMYQERHKGLERSCTSSKSVAPVRKRILVYPDSDEEDEEYCSLLPLLPCFQTPQLCVTLNPVHHINHSEVDIESMTLEEYARYELAMSTIKNEIQVPTQGAKNIRNMEHEVPNRCDDINGYEDCDHENGELLDLPTFFARRHKGLERSFTSSKSVALVRNIILVYHVSDEEYEEFPLKVSHPSFSIITTYANLTLDKEDSSLDEILDDLFKIGVENLRKMEHEVPNRRDDVNDFEDYDQEDDELPDLPTFSATDEFASNSEQVEENIDIAEEKEEVPMKTLKWMKTTTLIIQEAPWYGYITKRTETMAKRTKPSTGSERARKYEAEDMQGINK
ncbi:hypothetical protein Tco_0485456 [Tanacetum coccineum]